MAPGLKEKEQILSLLDTYKIIITGATSDSSFSWRGREITQHRKIRECWGRLCPSQNEVGCFSKKRKRTGPVFLENINTE